MQVCRGLGPLLTTSSPTLALEVMEERPDSYTGLTPNHGHAGAGGSWACSAVFHLRYLNSSNGGPASRGALERFGGWTVAGRVLPGPARGLLSNPGNELPEETYMLTKQRLIGKAAWEESSSGREPRELLGTWPCSLRFCGNGVRFWIVSGQLPVLGLTQGPPWWQRHLSAKIDSSSWEAGCLPPRAPPKSSGFVFRAAPSLSGPPAARQLRQADSLACQDGPLTIRQVHR